MNCICPLEGVECIEFVVFIGGVDGIEFGARIKGVKGTGGGGIEYMVDWSSRASLDDLQISRATMRCRKDYTVRKLSDNDIKDRTEEKLPRELDFRKL
ncbi:hypothetical protein TgHK011_009759 [Trichoderma gracile]|nr:hypothetical protein TgHK011_009759 [Trichoderma gracile]